MPKVKHGIVLRDILKFLYTLCFAFSLCATGNAYTRCDTYGYRDPDGISLESLMTLIEEQRLTTIEDVLRTVSQETRLFDCYVLMYRSRSLQQSSFNAPRAIAFGHSGKFVLSFNGESTHRGHRNLELMQYRDEQRAFEFRELSFTAPGERPSLSAPNPAKCLRCHQNPGRTNSDPRPNWEPYSVWPGAYGSFNGDLDPIEPYTRENDIRFLPEDSIFIAEQTQEKRQSQRFLAATSNHPRYRWLGEFSPHATTMFTQVLAELNFTRVVRLLQANASVYDRYKYALAYLIKSDEIAFPEELWQWHYSQIANWEFERSANITSAYMRQAQWQPPGRLDRWPITQGLQLIFAPLNFDMHDWPMDFKTRGRFAFSERYGVPTWTNRTLEGALRSADPDLMNQNIDWLKAESLRQLNLSRAEWERLRLPPIASDSRPLIQVCASCHDSGLNSDLSGFPAIPFNSPTNLNAALQVTGYPRGNLLDEIIYRTGAHAPLHEQMPPNSGIDPGQREQLIHYLRGLRH